MAEISAHTSGSVKTGNLAVTNKALPSIVPVRIEASEDEITIESLPGRVIPLKASSVVALSVLSAGSHLPNRVDSRGPRLAQPFRRRCGR